MERLLSVAKAARLAGVSRSTIQIAIKEAHECSHQQKLIIQALLSWMLNRLDGEI
jgi:hypothetical protein